MGAASSQDKASEPSEEGQSSNISQTNNNTHVAKPNHQAAAITEVSLPHKCENILKQADSPVAVDRTSPKTLLDKLHAGVSLNQGKQRYWVEKESNSNCFTVFARDLSITWADDERFWRWPLMKESSDEGLVVAELVNVCWLEVHGRFDLANLSPRKIYEVVFLVKLKDPAYGWEVPVNFRLTLPDGNKQEHKESLTEKPRDRWIEIPAGEFKTSAESVGEMEFSLYEYEGGNWKRGLQIKGVSIRPKSLHK